MDFFQLNLKGKSTNMLTRNFISHSIIFFQVRRCAEGYERGFQLGEGEGKPWRFLLKESEKAFHSDNMIKDVNCPGERSRTQAELAALREARRDQVEEVDQLYSTRQVPFLPST